MNEFDRTMHDAFQSRHVPHDITPSLVDVRWRARRRHTRRNAALVGCAAITGAGAVAVLASRHPGEQTNLGAGTGAGQDLTATTVACYSFPTTTMPPTTIAQIFTSQSYIVQTGDTPTAVAQMFGIPLELLDRVNVDNTAYSAFAEGAAIVIPTTTTMPAPTSPQNYQVPCDPATGGQGQWHCTDQVGIDEFGRDVFLSCEQQVPDFAATTAPPPTVTTVEFFPTTANTLPIEGASTTTSSITPTTTITIPLQTVGGDSTSTTSIG
jgi:hypothetical protein